MDFDTPTLTYDEEDYGRTPPNQKAIFIYEWLRNLEDNITTVKKVRQQEALIKFSCFSLSYYLVNLCREHACEIRSPPNLYHGISKQNYRCNVY